MEYIIATVVFLFLAKKGLAKQGLSVDIKGAASDVAADKLLLHLKAPEGIEVNVNVKKDSETIIDTYQEAIMNMIQKQKALIQNGGNMHDIVNASIKGEEKEVIDIEESESNV